MLKKKLLILCLRIGMCVYRVHYTRNRMCTPCVKHVSYFIPNDYFHRGRIKDIVWIYCRYEKMLGWNMIPTTMFVNECLKSFFFLTRWLDITSNRISYNGSFRISMFKMQIVFYIPSKQFIWIKTSLYIYIGNTQLHNDWKKKQQILRALRIRNVQFSTRTYKVNCIVNINDN